jgi:hypothetical protein
MAEIMSLSLRCIKLQEARLCIHHHTTQRNWWTWVTGKKRNSYVTRKEKQQGVRIVEDLVPSFFLHIRHMSLREDCKHIAIGLFVICTCGSYDERRAVLGRVGIVVCDDEEVDGVRELRGCAQAVYSGGDTQAATRVGDVCKVCACCKAAGSASSGCFK